MKWYGTFLSITNHTPAVCRPPHRITKILAYKTKSPLCHTTASIPLVSCSSWLSHSETSTTIQLCLSLSLVLILLFFVPPIFLFLLNSPCLYNKVCLCARASVRVCTKPKVEKANFIEFGCVCIGRTPTNKIHRFLALKTDFNEILYFSVSYFIKNLPKSICRTI